MYLFIFVAIWLTGILAQNYVIKEKSVLYISSIRWILGSSITVFLLYILSIFFNIPIACCLYATLLVVTSLKARIINTQLIRELILKQNLLFLIGVTTFYIVFQRSFSYDTKTHEFLISSNLYQDFGAHISFIRSFSLGSNIPFEVPFYASGGLIYHFMFYFFAGLLEYFGMRIDIALNIISAISFVSLLSLLGMLGEVLFKSIKVGILACVLLVFNGSLSFLNFFQTHGFNLSVPISIWRNSFYQTNTLFLGEKVDVFWNLNTYLNQRHFIFGTAFIVFIFIQLINIVSTKKDTKKNIYILAIISGTLIFWHAMAYISLLILLFLFILMFTEKRKLLIQFLAITFVIGLPLVFLIKTHSLNSISLHLGFLASKGDVVHIIVYWIINLGFLLIPLILVFPFLSLMQKKIYLIIMALFILPNIINFSTRFLYDNHKFFNLWIILMSVFCSYFFYCMFKQNWKIKVVSTLLLLLCVASGIIDIFVIKNDVYARISDFKYSNTYIWLENNTSKQSIFLTNGEIYDPLSLIGKKTYVGREFYIYVYGGNPEKRIQITNSILQGKNTDRVYADYIVVYKDTHIKNYKEANIEKLDKLYKKVYEDPQAIIYKT